ncbi:MspA family porin [Nocardia sp. NPDC050697]|uniref:MspA family porin n=1 Tax=Nocardia sp. NPDC050697 TaxID=3155158 RepID=UPI0033CE4A84
MPSILAKLVLSCSVPAVAAGLAIAFAPAATAEVVNLAPHELTFESPDGPTFVVGSTGESIDKVPPLNAAGTVREVYISGSSYTQSPASGSLSVGYHVGCAVDLQGLGFGIGPDDDGNPDITDLGFNASVSVTPGKVAEVQLAKKDVVPGASARINMRDIHLVINGCVGPAVIRQYTLMQVYTDQISDMGVVYGDPLWI